MLFDKHHRDKKNKTNQRSNEQGSCSSSLFLLFGSEDNSPWKGRKLSELSEEITCKMLSQNDMYDVYYSRRKFVGFV